MRQVDSEGAPLAFCPTWGGLRGVTILGLPVRFFWLDGLLACPARERFSNLPPSHPCECKDLGNGDWRQVQLNVRGPRTPRAAARGLGVMLSPVDVAAEEKLLPAGE